MNEMGFDVSDLIEQKVVYELFELEKISYKNLITFLKKFKNVNTNLLFETKNEICFINRYVFFKGGPLFQRNEFEHGQCVARVSSD
jgi:hypothetical protein